MEKTEIKTMLNEALADKYISSEEYQDKYYVYKAIQELLPDISENLIYSAIERVNQTLKSPIKGRKFVKIFVDNLNI
ncbi:MAG: hypothetical protein ACM34K_04385 [Bacillota bacterium]